jgi:catechol 2,3-dioxygenase-like lactoylglutathione lyase family enzyme
MTETAPKFAHVVIQTNRLEEMRDWYCTLLDAHVVYQNPGMCFLTFDEEHHRIAFFRPPGPPLVERTPQTTGLQHTAYTFGDLRTLLGRYTALKEVGITPFVPVQHGVTTSLYYRDPDGNLAELQIDNFEPAGATAYMEGPEYAADPIGPSFDPDLMLRELGAGAAPPTLTTRAWAAQSRPDLPHPMTVLAAASQA